ncbi:MAG: flagellar biosynthetic protein FliR [Acidobacteria bacterium]|nr:flagellar biosynthetic protein FliR [Acidobacteriota bacterium]
MPAIAITQTEILQFVAVLLRVSGVVVFAPFFGSSSFPYQVRIAFALVTSFLLARLPPHNFVPDGLGLTGAALIIAGEIVSGLILGLAANLVFAGIQYAGQLISLQMGFSLINLIDPQTNVESPVFSFIHNYIALLFFVLLDGHHWFLKAVSESFHTMPLGGIRIEAPLVEYVVRLSSQIFVIGLQIAGPVIVVTIITDIVVGIIGRAAPQLHILILGLPLKILVGFGCLSISLYFIPRYLETLFASMYEAVFLLIRGLS